MKNKTKTLVMNAMIAALYVALTVLVKPFASGAIQFRISEALNHIVVFNKKLMWGVVLGVVIFNTLFSTGLDVVFGGLQTLISLWLMAKLRPKIKNDAVAMLVNTLIFSVSMIFIAVMLTIVGGSFTISGFLSLYGTLALSEFIIMLISAPVMYLLNKAIHFERY